MLHAPITVGIEEWAYLLTWKLFSPPSVQPPMNWKNLSPVITNIAQQQHTLYAVRFLTHVSIKKTVWTLLLGILWTEYVSWTFVFSLAIKGLGQRLVGRAYASSRLLLSTLCPDLSMACSPVHPSGLPSPVTADVSPVWSLSAARFHHPSHLFIAPLFI